MFGQRQIMAKLIMGTFLVVTAFHASTAQVNVQAVQIQVNRDANRDIILRCAVNDAFIEPVTWSANRTGNFMQIVGGNDTSDLQVLANNTLVIRGMVLIGVGYYRCESSLSFALSQVIGRSPLRIERHPLGNGDLLLACLVSGEAPGVTSVHWSYRRIEMVEVLMGGSDNDHKQVLANNTLIVRDFEMADEGEYVCNVTYQGWNWTAKATVRRRVSPVSITTYQSDNGDLFLTCTLDGMPISTGVVLWTIDLTDGGVVDLSIMPSNSTEPDDETTDYQILANKTLLVRDYSAEDAGTYRCNMTVPGPNGGRWIGAVAKVAGGPLAAAANLWLVYIASLLASMWMVEHF